MQRLWLITPLRVTHHNVFGYGTYITIASHVVLKKHFIEVFCKFGSKRFKIVEHLFPRYW